MKHLRTILLFLLLGAVVNVGVAWGIAWRNTFPGNTGIPSDAGFTYRNRFRKLPVRFDGGETDWLARRVEKTGTRLIVVSIIEARGSSNFPFDDLLPPGRAIRHDIEQWESTLPEGDHPGIYFWDGRGWPFVSLYVSWPWFTQEQWPSVKSSGGFSFGQPTDLRGWPNGYHQLRALPYTPLWPEFMANNVFYALMSWLLMCGPFALRRLLRRRRGLCIKCAYDLKGAAHAVCPECGATVREAEAV